MYNIKQFSSVYNDLSALPHIADVASRLGISERSTRRYAAELKRRRMAGEDVPALINRNQKVERQLPETPKHYEEPIDELIQRASRYNERFGNYHQQKGLVPVHIDTDKPFGIVGLPDNHLNNIGTDLGRAFQDAEFIAKHPSIFAVGVGDWIDNFIIGKLERERRKDIMSHNDSWRLLEHYIGILSKKLIVACGGNHDAFSTNLGGYDVLGRIFKDYGLTTVYDENQVRVRITTKKYEFVHLVRHKFRGSSKYNAMHGIASWILEQWQGEDVIWGGHIHVAGHVSIERFWLNERRVVHGIQLASYKKHDDYAIMNGFRPNVPFMAPMIIHIPETGRSIFFEDMYEGATYLELFS